MKTRLTMSLWVVLLSLFLNTQVNAQRFKDIDLDIGGIFIPCTKADLIVNSLTINSVNGNSFNFTYQVKNIGIGNLYLDRMYFQAYVSQDNVLDATDKPAGGSIFGNTAPTLSTNQTYSGNWTSNVSVNIEQYHYLIIDVRVRSGYSMPECSVTNNVGVKNLTPSFADLAVQSIAVNSINGNSVNFTYTIRNNGAATLYLDRFYFQAYVSQDAILTPATDVPAGGSIFSSTSLTLAPGATYSGNWTSTVSVNLEQYPYLIYDVRLLTGKVHPQTTTANDRYVKYLGYEFSDLAVSNIVINNVNENSFDFDYTIENRGGAILYLDRFYFQAYVSQDGVLDATDKPAGGSIFSNSEIALDTAETYTGHWTSNVSVSLEQYPYLIFDVKIRPGYSNPQGPINADRYVKYIAPYFADLSVEDIDVNNVNGNSVNFTYVIRNNGASTLYLDRFYFQCYVSQDAILTPASDVPAGGSIYSSTPITIAPGATYTGGWTSNVSVSLEVYKYLIYDVRLITGKVHPQTTTVNDRFVKLLTPEFADLDVMGIDVDSINNGRVNFNYYIQNTGASDLHLDRMYFQVYFSQDPILSPATDIPGGGSVLSATPQVLAQWDTLRASWTSIVNIDLEQYPYLIFDVRTIPGQVQPQSNYANDRNIHDLRPDFSDVNVRDIIITNINGNNIDFNYAIENLGQVPLHLEYLYFQAYVSQDSVLNPVTDVPAGGSIFVTTNYMLQHGQTYSGSWTSNLSVNLEQYPFLLFDVRVLPGKLVPQLYHYNDIEVEYIPSSFADAVADSLMIYASDPSSCSFTYTVRNDGVSDLDLNKMYFQTYVSTDPIYDKFDKPAGGSIFAVAAPVLSTGESFSGSWTSNGGVNLETYQYLIFIVRTTSGQILHEVSTSNNRVIEYIPMMSIAKAKFAADNSEQNELTMENLSNTTSTTYMIYSVSGEKMREGNFVSKEQVNISGMTAGIYIVYLSDGTNNESYKILVRE